MDPPADEVERGENRQPDWVWKTSGACAGALVGAMVGAVGLPIVAFMLEDLLPWKNQPPYFRLYCGLLGAAVGAVGGYRRAIRRLQRIKATKEVASRLGLDYALDADDELETHLKQLLAVSGHVSLKNVVRRELAGTRFLIGDLNCPQARGPDSGGAQTVQTIAYFESDHLRWPDFVLQPEGRLLNLVGGVVGLQDIDFDDYPKFSDAYHLSSTQPARVRRLFDSRLLRHFSDNPGLQVKAHNNRLVYFRAAQRCEPEQLEDFISESMDVLTMFLDAGHQLQAAGDEPPVAAATGPMLTTELVERFLASSPPRTVPPAILRRRVGLGNIMALLIGTLVGLVGVTMLTATLVDGGRWNEDRIERTGLSVVFVAGAAGTLYFAARYRARNLRLLRHGLVATGSMEEVEHTNVTINDKRQYRLKIRFETGAAETLGTCLIYGPLAEDARRLQQSGIPVRVLYDPETPQRILWAESLVASRFARP